MNTQAVDLLVMPYKSVPNQLCIVVRDHHTHEVLGCLTDPVPNYQNHPNEILVHQCSAPFLKQCPVLFVPTGVKEGNLEIWQITPAFRKQFLSQPMDKKP